MNPSAVRFPKRAVCLELTELRCIARALADLDIDSWGGIEQNTGFVTARGKICDAIASIQHELERGFAHA